MAHLIATFKQSLSRSPLYEKPEANTFAAAIKYFTLLLLVATAIKAIIFAWIFVPALYSAKDMAFQFIDRYPADLTLTLSKGELSQSRQSPIVVTAADMGMATSTFANFLVVDASKPLDLQTFATYNAGILVAKDGYMVVDRNGGYKIQSFKNVPDYTLDKATLESYRPKIASAFGGLSLILIPLALIFTFAFMYAGAYALALAANLVGVLLALIITRIKGHKLGFGQLYALSLYAYTVVVLIGLAGLFVGISGWISAAAFVLVLAFCVGMKKQQVAS